MQELAGYAPRYAEVAEAAHQQFPAVTGESFVIVERIEGSGTTDFGAPGKVAQADRDALEEPEADRLKHLLRASWEYLDQVAATAPATLKKGPRGGGRDRDDIVRHVLGAETAYARSAGLKLKEPPAGDVEAVAAHREAILDRIRPTEPGAEVTGKGWPVPYLVRRCAWHVLDHAWEIQDKSEP